MPGLRIILAEDAALLREGLVGILERAGHEVVAAVPDAEALLAYTAHTSPDVVVTDIRMPRRTPTRDYAPRSGSGSSILRSR